MINQVTEGESNMTISAQVIDTIVEWIDDNLHQPLRIEEIARHAGYSKWHLQRLFMQYKGESLGVISASVNCCWRLATCVSRMSGCTISVCAMGLILSRHLPASSRARSTSRLARTAKKITFKRTETVPR